MFAIAPTDEKWFNYLKEKQLNSYVNFWTPTPWNIKKLKLNDKFYFMLKSPTRKIGGLGEFVEYKNLTTEEAWKKFGFRNGTQSKSDFVTKIKQYVNKRSEKFSDNIDLRDYKIGCLVLKNCEFWDQSEYKSASDHGVVFPSQVVKIKFFEEYNPFIKSSDDDIDFFELVSEPRDNIRGFIKIREGQSTFKSKILKAYNNSCCITGENTPELLEAAHIQEYRNRFSNNVKNGLLLRVDFHKLFDNNLLLIDSSYKIHVSSLVENEDYKKYHGQAINLPSNKNNHPSIEALKLREEDFRN